ncbi:unnamed protein product [Thelazia callipaeda]|uniref:Protein kinase domain-containing protein n=1 Tax=Thelazia callipaeda TaxID=103827 RepID=A0A0N5CKS6_THECL|nr:unnamed protein product [Thelazia callipaeda]
MGNQSENKLLEIGSTITLRGKMYEVQDELYSGPFSKVYTVCDGSQQYALKTERTVGSKRPVLKLDASVLKQIDKQELTTGFPRLIAAGRTPLYKFVLMELVGPDLQRLRRSTPGKKFRLSTSLRIASQTLKRIEVLHDCGWLCRDIKANNFCIGKENDGLIYMLDFGFARKFMQALEKQIERKMACCSRDNGTIVERRNSASLMGTIFYAPINAHNFSEQCRKDDLESWFYMIVEMIAGSLPWSSYDPKKEYLLVGEWKTFARGPGRCRLLQSTPAEFNDILRTIDETAFNDRPRYRIIQSLIHQTMDRLQIDKKQPFEWQETDMRKTKGISKSNLAHKFCDHKKTENDDNINTIECTA